MAVCHEPLLLYGMEWVDGVSWEILALGLDWEGSGNQLGVRLCSWGAAMRKNMVRTLKVFVERKTFLVRLEGEHRGNWCYYRAQ